MTNDKILIDTMDKLLKQFGWPATPLVQPYDYVASLMQAPSKPVFATRVPDPPQPKPIRFDPVRKRRNRQTQKHLPFAMKMYCDNHQYLRIKETLIQQLGPKDYSINGNDIYFAKRDYATLLMTLYRGSL